MLCRRCQSAAERPPSTSLPLRITQPRVPNVLRGTRRDDLCSGCGCLLGPEDTAQRVREKQSQLARFGLADRILKADKGATDDSGEDVA